MSAIMAAEQYFRNEFFSPTKYIDGFLYVSNFAKSIQEKYMPSIKDTPNITLYNFSTDIVGKNKMTVKTKYYLFFGRLSYEKGVKTLLEAFKDLPESHLKIVGTGPKEKELKNYIATYGMKNVEFVGYKKGHELTDLVRKAYFVIVPSEWYENNPMAIIEAYSTGTPILGARIGGIPEIVIEKETGYLFMSGNSEDLKNKVELVDGLTAEKYSKLSEGVLKFAGENLSTENYYPKLIAFYNRFLHK